MSIEQELVSQTYSGPKTTGDKIDIPFHDGSGGANFFDDDDIKVYKVEADGTETLLTAGAHYQLNKTENGGLGLELPTGTYVSDEVEILTASLIGATEDLKILRDTTKYQSQSFTDKNLELALDKLTAICQEVEVALADSSLADRVTQNETDIATNESDIASNVLDIAANSSDISTNTSGIAANVAAIAANVAAIAAKEASILALEAADVVLGNRITTLEGLYGAAFGFEGSVSLGVNGTDVEIADLEFNSAGQRSVRIQYEIERRTDDNSEMSNGFLYLFYKYDPVTDTYSWVAERDTYVGWEDGVTFDVVENVAGTCIVRYSTENMTGANYYGKMRYIATPFRASV